MLIYSIIGVILLGVVTLLQQSISRFDYILMWSLAVLSILVLTIYKLC